MFRLECSWLGKAVDENEGYDERLLFVPRGFCSFSCASGSSVLHFFVGSSQDNTSSPMVTSDFYYTMIIIADICIELHVLGSNRNYDNRD